MSVCRLWLILHLQFMFCSCSANVSSNPYIYIIMYIRKFFPHSFLLVLLGVAVLLLSGSCVKSSSGKSRQGGDTIRFKYSEHITAVRHDGYTLVSLDNPWRKGSVLHRYVLVDRKDSAHVGKLPEGTVVYTPVMRSVVFTSPHCYLFGALGAGKSIGGVCDLSYINLPDIQQGVRKGLIADCGNSMSPSVERIVSLQPQAILVSPFEGANYGQLDHIGVPIIECADYMETSALGRAEWMRFYGMLMGKEREADSLFAVVERTYREGVRLASSSHIKPKVITERVVSGVWYCPGGKSSMGRLVVDAGGRYAFSADEHSGSLTLAPEKVVADANEADCWLFIYNGGKAPGRGELLAEYPGYKMLKAFREGGVYGCGSATGVPYFEEVSFRPDMLLMDFVRIFHPDLGLKGPERYYQKLWK